jgi:flagellar M-ring protein FliF
MAPIGEQLRNFWQQRTLGQRIALVGGVVAVVGLGIWLLSLAMRPEMRVLFSGLDAQDAAAIVEKLKEQGIPYELADQGTTIRVPASVLYDVRLQVAAQGLPSKSVVGYEIFDKSAFGMSDFVQKLNYRRALEGELARTISTLEEVQSARVHIVIPERTLFEEQQRKPTASVILHLKEGRSLSRLNIEGIQHLVASSVEGLEPTAVTVVDQRGRLLSEPARQPGSLAGLTQSQYELQQRVDQYLTAKVQSLLDGVLGVGNAVVQVATELDFTQIERTREDFDPERQVVRSEQTVSESSSVGDTVGGQRPGGIQRSNSIINYEIARTVERITNVPGAIKRLTVAALINGTTQFVQENGQWKRVYIPRTQEEMDKLTEIIKNAVGYDPARNDQVSVVNVQFDTGEEPQPPRRWYELAPEQWVRLLLVLGAILLGIFALRNILRSPLVRPHIEVVPAEMVPAIPQLAPETPVLPSAEGVPALPGEVLEELPSGMPQAELEARIRHRLEALTQQAASEEALLTEQLRERIQQYVRERPRDAARLVKLLMGE